MTVEGRRNSRFGDVGPKFVTGDLFADEAVVRFVGIEAVDDVIAVAPCVGPGLIRLKTLAFGETRYIQPVAAPALAITRRGEQPIDQALPSLGGLVGYKCVHFFESWRQPGQV